VVPSRMVSSSAMDALNWLRPANLTALPESDLHIWRASLDVDLSERTRLHSHLSDDELLRADRFVFPNDRDHFIVGRGRLRELLGMYLHRPPESLRFRTGQFGKPSVSDHRELCFNLSHSHGLALYAFAMRRELGIDVEKIRAEFATEEIADRYFSDVERRELRELAPEVRTTAFFLCWTRKEAYVKAQGDGLQIPLDSFDVSLTPGKVATLRSGDSRRWSLESFTPEPGYAAAVLAEREFQSIRFWTADGVPR
jgi:4'-phosphopantetheinyl transferase